MEQSSAFINDVFGFLAIAKGKVNGSDAFEASGHLSGMRTFIQQKIKWYLKYAVPQ